MRGGDRRQFQGKVQISWQTRSGETKTIRAKCLDLSDQGARMECESPIEFLTNVYLQAPAYGLMGNASVRYCRRSGTKHIVGLLFSSVGSQAEQGRKRILIESQPGAEK
ncbi:MAG: hypothetical protein ABSG65_12795 [Bryobacteraceae bacterium]